MIDPKLRKLFPKDFLWGASVASHQVEGGNHNQWTLWEHEKAAELAASAEKRLSWVPVWDEIRTQAQNPLTYVSGSAVEHYDRFELDFALARQLNFNAMRGGIEWSRINPSEGVFDPAAIDHYSTYFNAMHTRGLEPFVNLFHWTLPTWFAEKGGFAKRSNMKYWRDFVHTVVQNLDFSNISYVITINEANTYSGMGYFGTEFPPGETNFWKSLLVYRRLAYAHRVAYKIIKAKYPHVKVGFAHQYNKVVGQDFVGSLFAAAQRWYWNYAWIKLTKKRDFIGINYYFADYRSGKHINLDLNSEPPRNDMGWHMEPSGLYDVLIDVRRRFGKTPIVITENGLADMHDAYREWWIGESIEAMAKAIKKGVKLQGYLHWSLLDNFEWQHGWWPKFGLIAIDRKTMKRTVRKSALAWARWLK